MGQKIHKTQDLCIFFKNQIETDFAIFMGQIFFLVRFDPKSKNRLQIELNGSKIMTFGEVSSNLGDFRERNNKWGLRRISLDMEEYITKIDGLIPYEYESIYVLEGSIPLIIFSKNNTQKLPLNQIISQNNITYHFTQSIEE